MKGARVLVIGSGGREHALAWALARSSHVAVVFVAPGNAGTRWAGDEVHRASHNVLRTLWDAHAPAIRVPIREEDLEGLLAFAQEQRIDLTVVGPEAPLAAGIVDRFREAGLRIFGPSRAAAQIEASKAFAKAFMRAHGIPTADFRTFSNPEDALAWVRRCQRPLVVKASGLAGGKGTFVCETPEAAEAAVRQLMVERIFGDAGRTVVIEERLTGEELSVLAFTDGRSLTVMVPARDYKRLWDGDAGPNTGGMGAYAPVPEVSPDQLATIQRTILAPAVAGLAARGTPFVGVLYAGLMLTQEGPRVLEFNARFGDPEAQALLPLLETDLLEILVACVEGTLDRVILRWRPGSAVTVVLASAGYPGPVRTGLPIRGLETVAGMEGVWVFHAGTEESGGQVVTAGGRVLAVTAVGPDRTSAAERAYEAVAHLSFEGMQFRRDIGRKGEHGR